MEKTKQRQKLKKEQKPVPSRRFDDFDEVTQSYFENSGFAAVYTAGSTHIGTRDYQEDTYFVTESSSNQDNMPIKAFGIVCDGMGGLENGDKASKLAAEKFTDFFVGVNSSDGIEKLLLREIDIIDLQIKEECGFGDGMMAGTTVVAALILGKQLHWIGVGDSRIYVLRGDEIVQVTTDHVFKLKLLEKVDLGLITQEEADSHPQRGALISYVGSGDIKYINTNKSGLDLVHGDVVLLCSDGLIKALNDNQIAEIIKTWYGDMKEAANQLTLQAFDSSDGGKDNITVVLMQYLE